MTGIIAFLLKLGLGGIVDKAIGVMEKRAELENDKERLKAMTTVELAKAAVQEAQIMAEFNKAKLSYSGFWVFTALFIVPLGAWWTAVIVDSIFGFSWSVANLPTPEMRDWAGSMIRWLFYVGTAAGAVNLIKR